MHAVIETDVFMNDNIEYLQVLVVQKRFCQLQINFPVIARKDSCDSIHHVLTASCVNLKTKVLFLIFKATKKSRSLRIS